MNAARPTEFRTVSEIRLQHDLERMREARNRRIAEREEKFRPKPVQPVPVNFCAVPEEVETWRDAARFYIGAVACLIGWGLAGWLGVMIWRMW